jgi:hypothetical protein
MERNVHKRVVYTCFYISRFNPLINSTLLPRSREGGGGQMPFGKSFSSLESLRCHFSEIFDVTRCVVEVITLTVCCRLPVVQIMCSQYFTYWTQIKLNWL